MMHPKSITTPLIDARGHRCPVPSLRLQTYLRKHPDVLSVTLWADDPMARIDIPYLCQSIGGVEVEISEETQFIIFKITRNPKESL
jgi:tRNA 2-thiouridine synthesizing protein A